MVLESKIFMDYDKSKSNFYINYFIEDTKTVVEMPIKKANMNEEDCIISSKFDLSNKVYLIDINQY
ncbi:MAG: hypothetical protein ACFFB0_12990 [Promethearchaeota archaeon]